MIYHFVANLRLFDKLSLWLVAFWLCLLVCYTADWFRLLDLMECRKPQFEDLLSTATKKVERIFLCPANTPSVEDNELSASQSSAVPHDAESSLHTWRAASFLSHRDSLASRLHRVLS